MHTHRQMDIQIDMFLRLWVNVHVNSAITIQNTDDRTNEGHVSVIAAICFYPWPGLLGMVHSKWHQYDLTHQDTKQTMWVSPQSCVCIGSRSQECRSTSIVPIHQFQLVVSSASLDVQRVWHNVCKDTGKGTEQQQTPRASELDVWIACSGGIGCSCADRVPFL